MPVTASLIGGGIEAAKLVEGLIGKHKDKEETKQLELSRPKYDISPETQNELSLNESELQQGIGARAKRAYETLADKDTANSLAAILKGGGNLNSVGELYGAGEEGRLRLTTLNENARLNQIQALIASQRNMATEQKQQFEFNEWMPWADKAQANAASREGHDAQISSGLQGLGSTAMGVAQNIGEQNMFDSYLNPPIHRRQTTNTTGYMPELMPYNPNNFSTPPQTFIH